jgi:zinc protease
MTEKIAKEVGVAFEGHVPFGKDVAARYRLRNGLAVLVLVDRTAPVVAYHTWFRVGSRHETPGKTGLAHLFEHLMFNETEHLRAGQFDEKLEESGAETNAATWVDWTYYHEAVPKEALPTVVKLEADRMAHLVLRAPQVASEKEVVANERRYRVEDDVDGAANEVLYRTAFTVHPYHWPTIGWMQDIEGFTPEDCERFYRTYYAPNNATVVVVGDVKEKDVLRRIVAAYGAFPSAPIPPEDTHPEPPQLDERRVVLHKPTATEKLLVAWHGPALADPEHAPTSVLCELLFGGRASRLHRVLVDELELCIDVRGWVSTFRDPGLFEMTFTAREGKSHAAILEVLDRELAALRADVPTEDELARAKARLELAHLSGLDTANGKAEQLGFYDTVTGDPAGVFRRLEAIARVQRGDVRRVARRFLKEKARTVVVVLPEKGAS